jgi:hypothetical protein
MKRCTLLTVMLTAAWAQTPGTRPRPDANSYPIHGHVAGANIAAVTLSSSQVKNAFGSDTYKGYIVIEVAVFPDPKDTLDLSPKDFMLRIGENGELLRPSAPSTIALSIDEKNNPTHPPEIRRPVDVTTRTTIGYDSAGTYNPNTGKRQGVVYAGSEVDVAPGGSTPPSPRANRGPRFDDMEAELNAKALPEAQISRPVAGYLYFIPPKKKGGAYTLDYSSDAGRLQLTLPPPSH